MIKRSIQIIVPSFFVIACGSTGVIDDAGTDAATDSPTSSDAPSDANLGAPITGLTPGQWTWVDFPGAQCRDGSATGIGVSTSKTGSTKLMIFLEGGGACFNSTTCGTNPSHFDQTTFTGQFANGEANLGIFSRTDTQNSVADYNMVYVPYCTGDVHGGSAPDQTVPGVPTKQQFVGYTNMTQYLSRLVPTFTGTSRILLTGQSAGGFGAALNYVHVARAFNGVTVDLLDDSGPLMGNPVLAACLEQNISTLWGLSQTVVGQDCGGDCNDPGNDLLLYSKHIAATYPNARFAFLDSVADQTISTFFGFGASNCTSFAPVSPAQYEAGLLDMRTQVAADTNAGSFLFAGSSHTSLVQAYTTRMTPNGDGGSERLEDWVTALTTTSTVTNVGP